jgi:hypothetical protein
LSTSSLLEVPGGFSRTGIWVDKSVSIVKAAASTEDVLTKALLVARPWAGTWRVLSTEMALPHVAHARAEVIKFMIKVTQIADALQLSVPDIMAYPSDAPLPYQLRIISRSPVSLVTSPAFAELPETPADPAHLRLHLVRRLDMKGGYKQAYVLGPRPLGEFGSTSSRGSIRPKVAAPTFVPSSPDSDSGIWQRAVRYEGTLTFADTPSFSSRAISVSHLIRLHVPILRTTAVLAGEWNIMVSSGMEISPPDFDCSTVGPTAPHP